LSGCIADGISTLGPKHLQPLSPQMVTLLDQKGMDKNSPIILRIFKEESELEIWKQARDGRYALLKSYPICRWSGELGPKVREGDRQAPEGFYFITPELMNPHSSYHLAFNLGYPNAFDQAHGRTGAHLMVHGDCSSRGCYAMTDEQISEIFALARESFDGGQLAFQVQAYPFHMTPTKLARHRNSPHLAFWRMLKEGSDHFEVTRLEPKVDVCGKRYVFNAIPFDPSVPFNPQRPCPVFDVQADIASAVEAKKQQDEREYASLVGRGMQTVPVFTGRDGGMNPIFASKFQQPRSTPEDAQRVTWQQPLPGTVPETTRPPVEPTATASMGGPVVAGTSYYPDPMSSNSLLRLLGLEQKPADPQVKPAAASAVPTPLPPQKPKTATTPTQKPAPKSAAAPQRTKSDKQEEKPIPPASLPGAQPIRASDGFSYR
jgi:murein L,D-transpeptidase YafK